VTFLPPYAEDLTIGVPLETAPDITVDSGLAAQYLAITGDQLRLALSDPLSRTVTGQRRRLANPGLVISLSIGQSTVATQRVIANLNYANLTMQRPVHIGETIRTVVTPLAASWTRSGVDRAKVLLSMRLTTEKGETIADYQRLALLPVRDPDRFQVVRTNSTPVVPDLVDFAACVPGSWNSPRRNSRVDLAPGDILDDTLADTASSARELVRMTQNLAGAHRDARLGPSGSRLVYGGHTVGLAQASLSRTLPDLLTILAWRSCDHVAPVFEEDLLQFTTTVDDVVESRGFRLADLSVTATAHRLGHEPSTVLRWSPVVLLTQGGS
jgi:2-methylfumaryl-CoA hydratase